MKVSIITPTYNRTIMLWDCIKSVEEQNYGKIEHIIVDDGSDEMCEEIMNSSKIQYHRIEHSGCPAAINYGIKHANGSLICVLADDDILANPDSIRLRVQAFNDPLLEVIYTGYCRIYYNRNNNRENIEAEEVDINKIFELDYINIQTMMWRKSIHDKIGYFSEDLKFSEDWEFKIKCLMECTVKPVYTISACSRYHNSNKSIGNEEVGKYKEMIIKRMKAKYGINN